MVEGLASVPADVPQRNSDSTWAYPFLAVCAPCGFGGRTRTRGKTCPPGTAQHPFPAGMFMWIFGGAAGDRMMEMERKREYTSIMGIHEGNAVRTPLRRSRPGDREDGNRREFERED